MPRILRSIVPRIKESLRERGLLSTLYRGALLPRYLLREYGRARDANAGSAGYSEFDQEHGVDTDGDCGDGWTYLSDLEIPSSNWIHGNDYAPIEPARFHAILTSLPIKYEDFVFVDFGSGKGRALLMAAEFPFKRIVGVEFSPELHAVAQANLAVALTNPGKDRPIKWKCTSVESLCMDFLDFELPPERSVLFFFDPCGESVLSKMLARIEQSLQARPRDLYLIYVARTDSKERMLDSTCPLTKLERNVERNFCIYRAD